MIKILQDDVVNKIAAGEVIDRPASVVRELVDNSVDAGAKSITVEIERGGQGLIRVLDDGSGMSRDDALLCFERFATSKLNTINDLDSLLTRGFRGEALSSIAAVSKLTIRTRCRESELGTEITIAAGTVQSIKDCACQPGTDISLRNLFFNVPARKKFLRSDALETEKVKVWLQKTFLGAHDVALLFKVDGQAAIRLSSAKDPIQRGKEFYKAGFTEIFAEEDQIKICGLIAHPGMAQASVESLVILVNGRAVFDRLVFRAVKEGFQSMLKSYETPLGFISISIAPELVDVNVHPQKSEVRFLNPGRIIASVRNAVVNSVSEMRIPSSVPLQSRFDGDSIGFNFSDQSQFEFEEKNLVPLKFSELRYIGKILDCFLISEGSDQRFYLIDMHAAHERINYNKIRKQLNRTSQSQLLLLPITIAVFSTQSIQAERELLEKVGFQFEVQDQRSVKIFSAPAYLKADSIERAFREIATFAEEEGGSEQVLSRSLDAVAARLACHASVRSGDSIERAEVYALFAALDDAETGAACPHGRPVVTSFSRYQVERWFGRDK